MHAPRLSSDRSRISVADIPSAQNPYGRNGGAALNDFHELPVAASQRHRTPSLIVPTQFCAGTAYVRVHPLWAFAVAALLGLSGLL